MDCERIIDRIRRKLSFLFLQSQYDRQGGCLSHKSSPRATSLRTKCDVDKYVESFLAKGRTNETNSQSLSIARLYFDVKDFVSCQKYAEKHLTQEINDAAAYKLLGQALQKLGQMERALEYYKTSLDLDLTQTSTILDICKLLTDDKVVLEPRRTQYWCDKADDAFPKHPITCHLRRKLIASNKIDSITLIKLLKAQIEAKPGDASSHMHLLKHYMSSNNVQKALEHGCSVELNTKEVFPFENGSPRDNCAWYNLLNEILKLYSENPHANSNWRYQLLLLTVKERLCVLTLREAHSITKVTRKIDTFYAYDAALNIVAKAGKPLLDDETAITFDEFHTNLLRHHRGQFAFHVATYLNVFVDSNIQNTRNESAILMLIAFQSVPFISKDNPIHDIKNAANRWYLEACYRCSQAGYYLIHEYMNPYCDPLIFLEQDRQWKEQVYDAIYNIRYCKSYGDSDSKLKSYWLSSVDYTFPSNRKPHETEIKTYDNDAQRYFEKQRNPLQYFVWTLLQYENYARFECSTLQTSKCEKETLNMLDIYAFLYCTAMRSGMPVRTETHHAAHIVEPLYSKFQHKWWNCATALAAGAEISQDEKTIFKRGIEVLRCIGNHGLDIELLCKLGRIFSDKANISTNTEEKKSLELRALLYYKSALSLLEESCVRFMFKRKVNNSMNRTETKKLEEECRLSIGIIHQNNKEYDMSLEILSHLKTGESYYYIAETYRKKALEINSNNEVLISEKVAMLAEAKKYAYKAMANVEIDHQLYIDSKEILEDVNSQFKNVDPNTTALILHRNFKTTNFQNKDAKDLQTQPKTSERIKEIIKKIAKLTNDVNELHDLVLENKNNYCVVIDETSSHNHQMSISTDKNDSKDQDQKLKAKEPETKETLKIDNGPSVANLSTSGPGFDLQKDLQRKGARQLLLSADQKAASKGDKNTSGASEEAGADEEYDPHHDTIVPLPEKIVVTTGEEDEEKVFGERCKLYRYDEKTREWKERGVGEIKILHHPLKKTYRLLLRREQVHKAVLNMLLFMELELLPMKNSDRAWTWIGRNFAENPAGEQETLAVRFKSIDLANSFRDNIVQCTRKLQAAAATAIREEQEAKEKGFDSVAPLRLPKHLADSARADSLLSAGALQAQSTAAPAAVVTSAPAVTSASVFGSAKTATPASVFGSAPTATPASVFGSALTATPASVFGSAPTATAASVFGSTPTATPASVFGSTPTATPASVFGSTPAATPASVFGSTPTATPASVFGSASKATPASVFGSTPTATPASVFGSALTATPASVFGSALTATPASVFGSAPTATAASVFGSTLTATPASVFGSTPTATPGSVFGSTPTATPASVFGFTPTATPASVFGSTPTATPASVFGSASKATPASVFGSTPTATPASVFGSALTATPASVFGSALTATPASVFGSAPTATAASVFGSTLTATPASVFGSTPTATPASVFGSTPTATPGSVFGSTPTATPASVFGFTPTATPASVFGSASKVTPASVFGSTPTATPASVFGSTLTATPASVFGSTQDII